MLIILHVHIICCIDLENTHFCVSFVVNLLLSFFGEGGGGGHDFIPIQHKFNQWCNYRKISDNAHARKWF